MMRWIVGTVTVLALLLGCATSVEQGALNPNWFGRGAVAPESRLTGRVALLVPPTVQGTVHFLGGHAGAQTSQIPSGRIVEQAMLTALSDSAAGQVQLVSAMPTTGDGFDATLVVDAVRFESAWRTVEWLVPPLILAPIPLLGPLLASGVATRELDTQLAFDLRLLDAGGHTVLTRTYDGGRVAWTHPPGTRESMLDGLARMAHEAAWRMSQQAVQDLREWLKAQRDAPRNL